MVALTWVTLVVAAAAAVASGRADVAVALGGAKAALVGITFLELRHAARAHLAAWLVFMAMLTAGLVFGVR